MSEPVRLKWDDPLKVEMMLIALDIPTQQVERILAGDRTVTHQIFRYKEFDRKNPGAAETIALIEP